MRKRLKLLFISLFILIPFKVNALNGSLSMNCTAVNSVGESTCTITGNSDDSFIGISAQVTSSENIEIGSFIRDSSVWDGSDFGGNKIDMYVSCENIPIGDCVLTGNFNVGTIKVKVKDNFTGSGTVKLSSIVLESDNVKVNLNDVTSEVKSVGLKSLTISDNDGTVTLGPKFDTNTLLYTVEINSDTFSIDAVANNSNNVVIKDESGNVLNASNIHYIAGDQDGMIVFIEVGSVKYSLLVKKKKNENVTCDNSLSSLIVGGKPVSLEKGKYNYEEELDDVSKYSYKATLSDSNNYAFDSSYPGEMNDITGSSFTIKVVPSNKNCEDVATYNISVKKSISNPSSSEPSSSKPSSSNSGLPNTKPSSSNNDIENPKTSDISMFLMSLILIGSFIISISLYRKNISYYNE